LFKKETEYAIRGLVYIQSQNTCGRRPGIAEIADEIGVDEVNLWLNKENS